MAIKRLAPRKLVPLKPQRPKHVIPLSKPAPKPVTKPSGVATKPRAKTLVRPFGNPVGVKQKDGTHIVSYKQRPKSHPMFAALRGSEKLVHQTVYVVDFAANRIVQLTTTCEDGTRVGWDMCGGCHFHITNCWCPQGFKLPRYIENWMPQVRIEDQYHARESVAEVAAPVKRRKGKPDTRRTNVKPLRKR